MIHRLAEEYLAASEPSPDIELRQIYLKLQEFVYTYSSLAQNSPQCSLGQGAWMTGHGGSCPGLGIPPDFMTALGMAVKNKTGPPQLSYHIIRGKSGKPGHTETLTGMRISPSAGAAAFSEDGSSSPCS
jgi:hypothetical protein